MRCYFMRRGHIASVEILEGVTDDDTAIKLGSAAFIKRLREGFEGFEIWERDRIVFRYPDDENQTDPTSRDGKPSARKGSRRKSSETRAVL